MVALSNIADAQVIDKTDDAVTDAANMNNLLSPDSSVGSAEESLELSDMTIPSVPSAAGSEEPPQVVLPVNLVVGVADHRLEQNPVTTAVGTTNTVADADLLAVAILLDKKNLLTELVSCFRKLIDVSTAVDERETLARTLKEHQDTLDNINNRLTNSTMCTTPMIINLPHFCDESFLVRGNNNDAGVCGNDFLNYCGENMFFGDYDMIDPILLEAEFGHETCDASFESDDQFWNREGEESVDGKSNKRKRT